MMGKRVHTVVIIFLHTGYYGAAERTHIQNQRGVAEPRS